MRINPEPDGVTMAAGKAPCRAPPGQPTLIDLSFVP
jgi:hypothetical protein